MSLLKREWPWCTIFLVFGAVLCHTLVLMGNWKTSAAMQSMGTSTGGWSNVGLGLARALETELDEIMANVTGTLTVGIEKIMSAQAQVDSVLAVFGVTVDNTVKKSGSLLEQGGNVEVTIAGIMDAIMKAFQVLPHFQDTTKVLKSFMDHAKPALYQVGSWIESFSDKIQAGIEAFGNTIDAVTKLIDQIMSQLHGGGAGADIMVQQTFNLFDVDHTGAVTEKALHEIADLYSITAVAGKKGSALLAKYDENKDKQLSKDEFARFAEDETVPAIMATVLRMYSKKLAKVSGNLGSAKMRDEVAKSIVKYLQLVASKNLTKVEWIAQRLSNSSLPAAFTADVLAELAFAKDDPNVLTKADVGGITMGAMLQLNSSYVLGCLDLVSKPAFWANEGLNPDDQPKAVAQITKWTVSGPKLFREMSATLKALQFESGNTTLNPVDSEELLQTMPAAARKLTEASMQQYVQEGLQARMQQRKATFQSETSRFLLQHLMGGVAASDGANPAAERAMKAGVPAVPVTLEFAKFLANNASQDSADFTKYCMDYTGQSSGPLDAFNTQISGMVKKTSGFIDMLKEHATRAGIDKMEDQILEFATKGVADVQKVVMKKVVDFVNKTFGGKVSAFQKGGLVGVRSAGKRDGVQMASLISLNSSDVQTLQPADLEIRKNGLQLLYATAMQSGGLDVDAFSGAAKNLFDASANGDASLSLLNWRDAVTSDRVAEVLEDMDIPGLDTAMLVELDFEPFDHDRDGKLSMMEFTSGFTHDGTLKRLGSTLGVVASQNLAPSAIWDAVTSLLRMLTNVLPTAIKILKEARLEVSGVGKQLDNIFATFQVKGPAIFETIASLNSKMWFFYYMLLVPLTIGILGYGFYASGWCENDENYEGPSSLADQLCVCRKCCGSCWTNFEDTSLCLWSLIVVMQVIVLIVFIVSIILTILAGVKAFITAGCSQVYIINDDKVCTETMNGISHFLSTFYVGDIVTSLNFICDTQSLKTCQMITEKMMTSTTYTVFGSFAATIFSFELILQTAMLHERAKMRRVLDDEDDKHRQAQASKGK